MSCEQKFESLNADCDFVLQLKTKLFIQSAILSSDKFVTLANKIFTKTELVDEMNICGKTLKGDTICPHHERLSRILTCLTNEYTEVEDAETPEEYLNRKQLRVLYRRCIPSDKSSNSQPRRSLKGALRTRSQNFFDLPSAIYIFCKSFRMSNN